jgi:hypothetical protein
MTASRDRYKVGVVLADTVAVVGRLGEQPQVVGDADERPPVAGKYDDGKRPKDGVDRAALESELA